MNWGKGITIGIIAFMLFILSFVYKAFQHDFDLVRDDYYEHEAEFEKERESKHNYEAINGDIEIVKQENGICFQFPNDVSPSSNGSIEFYRPDAKDMDRSFKLDIDVNNQQCVPYEEFFEGYYDITVEWKNNSTNYIFEDYIQF